MSRYFSLAIVLSVMCFSCRKPRPERYPEVKVISIDHDRVGNVLTLVGELVDDGGEKIERTGFCVSPYPDFYRDDILSLAELEGNRFEFTYYLDEHAHDNSPLVTYYRLYVYAYAVNKYGFGVSEVETTD